MEPVLSSSCTQKILSRYIPGVWGEEVGRKSVEVLGVIVTGPELTQGEGMLPFPVTGHKICWPPNMQAWFQSCLQKASECCSSSFLGSLLGGLPRGASLFLAEDDVWENRGGHPRTFCFSAFERWLHSSILYTLLRSKPHSAKWAFSLGCKYIGSQPVACSSLW